LPLIYYAQTNAQFLSNQLWIAALDIACATKIALCQTSAQLSELRVSELREGALVSEALGGPAGNRRRVRPDFDNSHRRMPSAPSPRKPAPQQSGD
jgi:hypothetical protein